MKYYKPYRKAKVFHIHFADTSSFIVNLKKIGFIKSKIMTTFHGYDAYYKDVKERKKLMAKYKRLFDTADKITINTRYLENKVIALGCPLDILKTIPVGINTEYYQPIIYPKAKIQNTRINLLSVGRLIELKGHRYGILATKQLVDKGLNIVYTIIREGAMRNELESLIKELELGNHVVLYGRGTQEEIKNMLEETNVFLMTSVTNAKGREEAQGYRDTRSTSYGCAGNRV